MIFEYSFFLLVQIYEQERGQLLFQISSRSWFFVFFQETYLFSLQFLVLPYVINMSVSPPSHQEKMASPVVQAMTFPTLQELVDHCFPTGPHLNSTGIWNLPVII